MKTCTGCRLFLPLDRFRSRNEKSRDGLRTRCKSCEQAAKGTRVERSVAERFWGKVDKSGQEPAHMPGVGGCWLWTGGRISTGYGGLWMSEFRRQIGSHRISFALANGFPLPVLQVLHRCDNELCVRPDHLFLGTQLDNMRDKVAKGRQARGIRCGNAHLTDDDVRAIRIGRILGGTLEHIGARVGCGKSHALRIWNRESRA